MPPRPGRPPAALVLVLALAGAAPATAQGDRLPEEVAHDEALARAQGRVDAAYQALEAYGRGAPVVELDAERARSAGMSRLFAPVTPPPKPARRRRPPLEVASARMEMLHVRKLIRARLHALAPDRFPDPDAPPPEVEEDEGFTRPHPLRMLDVQDLVFTPEDHRAPNTGLGVGRDASGAFDSYGEETGGVGLDGDKLVELVENELGDDVGGSIEYSKGRLLTRLPAAASARVDALLALLRRDRGGLVDLEVRVYQLTAEAFAAVRDQAAGLSDEAEARLQAGDGATLLAEHHVTAHDGQRVHVWRGRSRSYLADIEVNQTGVVPVLNPVIAVINEGLVVEARPLVDRARGQVLVDVALTLSRVQEPVEMQTVTDLEVELPRLEIARTTASGAVQLGRGALLGGVLRTGAEGPDAVTCVVYVRPRLIAGGRSGR